jgi:hypothetical protein
MTQVHSITVTRHDVSLAGIGLVLLAGLVVGLFPAVDLSRALFVASVPATGGVFYTLFYRPPEPTPDRRNRE